MILKKNLEKNLKEFETRIKDLEQRQKNADEENQLLCNEIGIKDLNDLKKLLVGRKITEILDELDDRKLATQNLNFDLTKKTEEVSTLINQFKYFQETINNLEKKVGEREEEARAYRETINNLVKKTINDSDNLEQMLRERIEEIRAYRKTINDSEQKVRKRDEKRLSDQTELFFGIG
ncbi:14537_t:CDS:2 [Funneliformis geosporum]|uniref:14537_t:CDS:1 n=1 Tax=Funneliformis geosporum TaxID=1117311 RepID=A0A9W4SK11_9GLOM|nr:14537_t:CDS:2 [Funneliformis geosporum]